LILKLIRLLNERFHLLGEPGFTERSDSQENDQVLHACIPSALLNEKSAQFPWR
jgi:hypothetical protein